MKEINPDLKTNIRALIFWVIRLKRTASPVWNPVLSSNYIFYDCESRSMTAFLRWYVLFSHCSFFWTSYVIIRGKSRGVLTGLLIQSTCWWPHQRTHTQNHPGDEREKLCVWETKRESINLAQHDLLTRWKHSICLMLFIEAEFSSCSKKLTLGNVLVHTWWSEIFLWLQEIRLYVLLSPAVQSVGVCGTFSIVSAPPLQHIGFRTITTRLKCWLSALRLFGGFQKVFFLHTLQFLSSTARRCEFYVKSLILNLKVGTSDLTARLASGLKNSHGLNI